MDGTISAGFRPISGIEILESATPAADSGAGDKAGPFAEALADAIGRVEDYRVHAEKAVNGFLLGENEELHKLAAATQQAELSFDLFLQVKNKVVQAYQEIMRMEL